MSLNVTPPHTYLLLREAQALRLPVVDGACESAEALLSLAPSHKPASRREREKDEVGDLFWHTFPPIIDTCDKMLDVIGQIWYWRDWRAGK
ncbi:hypothetical protein PsorP6_005026 [Peronosclerospora sorghi]|uniref:Uncharacterized protein n=1 Tax=Peronosclerospora sorghi TaxID=230839 RepID=A0ACC0W2V4_9STRA|nr:hypothetical protein PsorP6_005026 [Peronosclerospora sorghi]